LLNMQKWLMAAVIVFFALMNTGQTAFANSLNNSVKDCFQNPEKCTDKNLAPNQSTSVQKSASTQVGVTIWDFIRMIFATIFVVVLLYLLLKFINKKSRSYKSTQLVENLGGTPLGGNRSVQIVKISSQVFIVGVGENVQLLKEIDNVEERNQLLSDYNTKLEQTVQPSDIVTKIMEKTRKWKNVKKEDTTFSSLFKEQLDEISKGRKKLFAELEKRGKHKQ
jgi:flagellar protein FliO/FliZ